ncbi:MAG: hypothetical protein WCP20_05265 [Desulfuromonadales bacterium]
MKHLSYVIILFCCLFSTACFNAAAPNKGARLGTKIAFDYHPLTDDDIHYLSRFDIIVTHNIEKESVAKRLKVGGGKIFFYEWLSAFYYVDKPGVWERLAYKNREKWTLDPRESDPNPMGDKLHCKDFFYDMGDEDLIEHRVNYLVRQAKSHGYDGIFFDWGSGWHSLQEHGYTFLTEEFTRRHPEKRYNDGVNLLLRKLKEKGLFIIVNGGFRSENAELDRYADVDIVESMFTTEQCESSGTIHVQNEGLQKVCETSYNTLDRSLELAVRLPQKAVSANRDIRFLFLNYAFPYLRLIDRQKTVYEKASDRQAIYYSLAMSYLGNASGFTNGPDVSLKHVKDEVYFTSIGSASSDVLQPDESTALRYFTSGFVVATDKEKSFDINVPAGVTTILDMYNSSRIKAENGRVHITMKPQNYQSGATYPLGRIFLYEP